MLQLVCVCVRFSTQVATELAEDMYERRVTKRARRTPSPLPTLRDDPAATELGSGAISCSMASFLDLWEPRVCKDGTETVSGDMEEREQYSA